MTTTDREWEESVDVIANWLAMADYAHARDAYAAAQNLREVLDARGYTVVQRPARWPDTLTVYPANEILYGRCETCGKARWHTAFERHGQPPSRSEHCGCCTHPHNLGCGAHENWQAGKPCPCILCGNSREGTPDA